MTVTKKIVCIQLMIGICLIMTKQGWGDSSRGIMVFARDSSNGNSPPPSTTAKRDGIESHAYGTNDVVIFTGYYEDGTHELEVSTEANGYMLRQSPSDPNAINNPYSDYGNPRYVDLSASNNYVHLSFQFDPVITASAVVRDAWTMERIENASIEFIYSGSTGYVAVCKYPCDAVYADDWLTYSDGGFPTNTILYNADYDLQITKSGYQSFYEEAVLTNALPGDDIDLGTVLMEPIDNNGNRIADAWETAYFGAGYTVVTNADEDGDGVSNLSEYISGTDPTNSLSCLWVEPFPLTNGLALAWYVEPDRTYRVCGTTNLCTTNTWVQVGGPWEASAEQYEMTWVETNMDLSWNSNYRIEVVPCWWQGENQVLINTNRPSGPVGGGTYTNWPGPPPLP